MARLPRPALFAVIGCCVATRAVSGADYVGKQACAPCHPGEYARQTASHHAHSLHDIKGSILGEALLRAGHSPDGRLQYLPEGDGVLVRENGAPETVLIQWVFGAAAQGSTGVGLLGGQFIEHRFSYYSRIRNLAPTFGHPPRVSTPIAEFGVLQDSRTIFRCFNCHATAVKAGPDGPDLNGMLPGVQCERCHGPGSSHIEAARRGRDVNSIRRELFNPGRVPAKAQIEFCGQCHRLPGPDMGDEPELVDPVTVRFAPIGLLASKCFRVSEKLSCVTCHDPHENVRARSDSFYSEQCLTCHSNDHRPVKLCRRAERENCLPCHMKQASLGPYLRFTDHRIRVY